MTGGAKVQKRQQNKQKKKKTNNSNTKKRTQATAHWILVAAATPMATFVPVAVPHPHIVDRNAATVVAGIVAAEFELVGQLCRRSGNHTGTNEYKNVKRKKGRGRGKKQKRKKCNTIPEFHRGEQKLRGRLWRCDSGVWLTKHRVNDYVAPACWCLLVPVGACWRLVKSWELCI